MKLKQPLLALFFTIFFFSAYQKEDEVKNLKDPHNVNSPSALPHTKIYSSKVATDLVKFQLPLTRTTPGFQPGTYGRAFAYTGLGLYESVVAGMPSYQSYISTVSGITIPVEKKKDYYWPASANAPMAEITRSLFAAASAQDKTSIGNFNGQLPFTNVLTQI